MKRLPPYGREYLAKKPSSGAWVIVGSDAWLYVEWKSFPVMVLPPGDDPAAYHWPVAGEDVILMQHGDADEADVERTILELLRSGARLVVAIGLPGDSKYCYREARRVAA